MSYYISLFTIATKQKEQESGEMLPLEKTVKKTNCQLKGEYCYVT